MTGKKKQAKEFTKRLLAHYGLEIKRIQKRPMTEKRVIHFLHIGKNAGTQLAHIMNDISKSTGNIHFIKEPHTVSLRDLPEGAEYFFSIRNPVSRFKSGFYSRKRKGQPRTYNEWTPCEERAFQDFEHANDLAEALFEEGETGQKAFRAIKSISHTSMNQVDWFVHFGHLFDVRTPVAIIRQEHFDEDVRRFQDALGIKGRVEATQDVVKAHKNDYSDSPEFSDKAIRNLEMWYKQDLEFYQSCEDWIKKQK